MAKMNILTRTACLGGWVTAAKYGQNHNFYNQQKVRVDLFMDIVEGKKKIPPMKKICKEGLRRKDMGGVYGQTEDLLWTKQRNINLIIMDNFSELVDKRFESEEGWAFCGLYGEFFPEFIEPLTDFGLLQDVEEQYNRFFAYLKQKWNVPIIFIHFPTTFDDREKYIIQGEKIIKAMEKIAPKYNIQNLYPDKESIEQRDCDYYHFTDKTVKNIVEKIKS